jgi:chemotaxis protein MotB
VAKRLAPFEEEAPPACPEWMVTFSDCMTLLLTFFVLLMTFASGADEGKFKRGGDSFQDGGVSLTDDDVKKTSVVAENGSVAPREVEEGSEAPMEAVEQLISGSRANPKDNQSCSNKVFLISSESLFYGQSNVLKSEGKTTLRLIGQYIKMVQSRMVISESGSDMKEGSAGLPRSLAIMQFLEKECKLERERMCISIYGTAETTGNHQGRRTEISLLERSVCK